MTSDTEWGFSDPMTDRPSGTDGHRHRFRLIVLMFSAWLAVSLIALGILLVTRPGSHKTTSTVSTEPSRTTSAAIAPLAAGWAKVSADLQTDCAAHSYGKVEAFLASNPCLTVNRLLATANQGGRVVVIASHAVTFTSDAVAAGYLALVRADGTGNISDLPREGTKIERTSFRLPQTAAFAAREDGAIVYVAETAYLTGTTPSGDPALAAVAHLGVG